MKINVRGLLPVLFFLSAIASNSEAGENPLRRVCRLNGGQFEVVPISSTLDMALCRWGRVAVDAQTLLSHLDSLATSAASAMLSDVTAQNCAAASAGETSLPNGQTLCLFRDASKLTLDTLKAGLSDPDRLHLKNVLSTR